MTPIWSQPRTWLTGELATAALLNQHLRDNLDWLKTPPVAVQFPTSTVVVTNGIITETTDGACVARRADISMPALTRSVTYRNNVTNVARYDR